MTSKRHGLTSLTVIAIGLISVGAACANGQKLRPEVPRCKPVPKLLHHEIEYRESRIPHRGKVRLSFTIDAKGGVRDVTILESTDTWLNQLSVQSVLRWRFEPPSHPCRATQTLRFTAQL